MFFIWFCDIGQVPPIIVSVSVSKILVVLYSGLSEGLVSK